VCAENVAGLIDASDAELARAITGGRPGATQTAEGELYRRFAPRVRLYGLRHLRDQEAAGDLAQEVMVLTIERLRAGAVRDPAQIGSFILGASRTMTRDLQRRDRRREALLKSAGRTIVPPEPCTGNAVDIERLERCMRRLADRDRAVLFLTFYAEKKTREVGEELGVAEGHVRVIRHRALNRLRHCLLSREAAP
jgi:RNA polymerase sigma-70 factor (ECF subfamily)